MVRNEEDELREFEAMERQLEKFELRDKENSSSARSKREGAYVNHYNSVNNNREVLAAGFENKHHYSNATDHREAPATGFDKPVVREQEDGWALVEENVKRLGRAEGTAEPDERHDWPLLEEEAELVVEEDDEEEEIMLEEEEGFDDSRTWGGGGVEMVRKTPPPTSELVSRLFGGGGVKDKRDKRKGIPVAKGGCRECGAKLAELEGQRKEIEGEMKRCKEEREMVAKLKKQQDTALNEVSAASILRLQCIC